MATDGNILLFEDQFVDDMRPVTLMRPAFGVTCAVYNLFEIAHMVTPRVRYLVRDHLKTVVEQEYARAEFGDGPTLLVSAALVPDVRCVELLRSFIDRGEPLLCTADQRVMAALLPADEQLPGDLGVGDIVPWLLSLDLPLHQEERLVAIDYSFHIVAALLEVFEDNLAAKIAEGGFSEIRPGVYARDGVRLAETAVCHPDEGPIVLDTGVCVLDFAYLEGPLYIGPGSRIIERSSVKEFVSVAHTCKIGGEVECSTIEAYSNKQHHGFIGHSYIGSWVNMGAGTSNSDLKNTYGPVRVEHHGRRVETGMQFFGCVMGDCSKTAINTSIFTGKIIGCCSMLYGYVGQNVPSFCNFAKSFGQITECSAEQSAVTQKRMFERRDVPQTVAHVELLKSVYQMTRDERQLDDGPPSL